MIPVDISPITTVLINTSAVILTTVLTAAGGYATMWLRSKGIQVSQDNWNTTLNNAVTYGVQASTAVIAAKGWDHVDSKNAVLNSALLYITSHNPKALAKVSLTPDLGNEDNRAMLRQALERVLPAAAYTAAASPSTPPTALQRALVAPSATPPV
jgi:hypothetical protein